MFFDGFGREFTTDLTQSIASSAVTLTDLISSLSWNSQFISYAGDGYSASGFRAYADPNSVLSMGFRQENDDALSDLVVQAHLTASTQVTFGHHASTAGRIDQLDLAASREFDGHFMSASALNSPYLALSEGGNFGAGAFQLNDDVVFSFGHAQRQRDDEAAYATYLMAEDKTLANLAQGDSHQGASQSTVAAMSWKFSAWGTAGVNLTMADEQNSLLGSSGSGALAITSEANTTSVGFGTRVDLGDQWIASASWSMGKTEATPVAGSIVRQFSELESQAYGLAVSKTGIIEGGDSLGLSVSRPLHITGGTATIYASTGVTGAREIIYTQETVPLASATPETDYEIGYTTMLSADTSLQANFIYQQNVGGLSDEHAVAGLMTLKTRW